MASPLHHATIAWRREADDAEFAKGRYSRRHSWRFDGGVEIAASASPHVVPKAFAGEDAVDPEEAFIAALSACHMLTFLDLARRAGFTVDSYEDAAEGELEKTEAGTYRMARVRLHPRIAFAGKSPDASALDRLHEAAHAQCFIANSVTSEVLVEAPQ